MISEKEHFPLTLFFDSKVCDGSFGGDLWCVVRVAQFGSDVETEVWVILYLLVSNTYHVSTT